MCISGQTVNTIFTCEFIDPFSSGLNSSLSDTSFKIDAIQLLTILVPTVAASCGVLVIVLALMIIALVVCNIVSIVRVKKEKMKRRDLVKNINNSQAVPQQGQTPSTIHLQASSVMLQ